MNSRRQLDKGEGRDCVSSMEENRAGPLSAKEVPQAPYDDEELSEFWDWSQWSVPSYPYVKVSYVFFTPYKDNRIVETSILLWGSR